VDAGNDQAYSPIVALAPRLNLDPPFATRNHLEFRVNKVFNFDDRGPMVRETVDRPSGKL
jgi:hypothetical protein